MPADNETTSLAIIMAEQSETIVRLSADLIEKAEQIGALKAMLDAERARRANPSISSEIHATLPPLIETNERQLALLEEAKQNLDDAKREREKRARREEEEAEAKALTRQRLERTTGIVALATVILQLVLWLLGKPPALPFH